MSIIGETVSVVGCCFVVMFAVSIVVAGEGPNDRRPSNSESQEYALIYNGPVSAEDCPEAAAAIAERVGLRVRFVSDVKELPLLLNKAAVFIIGGTGDDLHPPAQAFTPKVTESFKDYLRNGGRYLGICGGGFMASIGRREDGAYVKALSIIPAEAGVFRSIKAVQTLLISLQQETKPRMRAGWLSEWYKRRLRSLR